MGNYKRLLELEQSEEGDSYKQELFRMEAAYKVVVYMEVAAVCKEEVFAHRDVIDTLEIDYDS